MTIERCPNGHPYTAKNTQVRRTRAGGKTRRCRICHRVRQRERYQKRRGLLGIRDLSKVCRNGHVRTPENTRIQKKGGGRVARACLICERRTSARRREKLRQSASTMLPVSPFLVDYVALTLGRRPKSPHVLISDMRNDYGSLSIRQLHRALAILVNTGRVRRVGLDRSGHVKFRSGESGYVLARRRAA